MSYAQQGPGSVFFASIILGWFRVPVSSKGSLETGDKGIVQVERISLNNALKQATAFFFRAVCLSTDTSVQDPVSPIFLKAACCNILRVQRTHISNTQYTLHIWLEKTCQGWFYFQYKVFRDRICGLVVRVSGYRYRGLGFDFRHYQIF